MEEQDKLTPWKIVLIAMIFAAYLPLVSLAGGFPLALHRALHHPPTADESVPVAMLRELIASRWR